MQVTLKTQKEQDTKQHNEFCHLYHGTQDPCVLMALYHGT